MSRILAPISRLMWDAELIWTRFSLGLAELMWGFMLLFPGATFERPTYHVMSLVMDENYWGLLFIVSSIMQLTVVYKENYHSLFAKRFAFFNAILWVFVTLSIYISIYPPAAAIAGDFVLAIGALWIWVRPYILAEEFSHGFTEKKTH